MSTLDFYNKNANDYINSTFNSDMTAVYDKFLKYVPKNGTILDLGCGSGRDSLYFKSHGFSITAVDGSAKMAERASKIIRQEVIVSTFEELRLNMKYDGIWACASLLHVNRNNIINVINNVSEHLKDDGIMYMSFKYGENEYIDDKGRYFNCYTKETFNKLVKEANYIDIVSIFKTGDAHKGREGTEWLNVLLKIK